MYVYIDESGILTLGQGDYFIVTAYVVPDVSVASRCLKQIRQNLKKQYRKGGEIKYNNSSKDTRRRILACLAKYECQIYFHAYKKRPLTRSQLAVKGEIFSLLLQKIKEDCGEITAVYIDRFLKKSQENEFFTYFCDIVSADCVVFADSERCPGIQAADFLSGALNQKYNRPDAEDNLYAIIQKNVIKVR